MQWTLKYVIAFTASFNWQWRNAKSIDSSLARIKTAHYHDCLKATPKLRQLTLTDREFQFAICMRSQYAAWWFYHSFNSIVWRLTFLNTPYHALCCSKFSAIERQSSQRAICTIYIKLFINCSREPAGFCSSDNKHSDMLIHFTHKQTFVDITIDNPIAKSDVRFATDNGRVCRELNFKSLKNTKRSHFPIHISVLSAFVTTFGEYGKQIAQLVDELAVDCAYDDFLTTVWNWVQNLQHCCCNSMLESVKRSWWRLKTGHFKINEQADMGESNTAQI